MFERIHDQISRASKVLLWLFLLGLALLSSSGWLAGLVSHSPQRTELAFPSERTDPKVVDYAWSYAGHDYSIQETLYGNLDSYYRADPVKDMYEGDSDEEYYGDFVEHLASPSDDTLAHLAADLRAAGARQGLSSEGVLELAVAFVQAIPYDEAKYKAVVGSTASDAEATWPRMPYEVLYDDTGICTDKSLLTVALAKELGYGTALFESATEQHMVAGIECPGEYSTFGSGYCYTEVTNTGFRIGDFNVGGLDSGRAAARALGKHVSTSSSDWRLFGKRKGMAYGGVKETVELTRQLADLESRAGKMKGQVESAQEAYERAGMEVESAQREADNVYRQYLARPSDAAWARYEEEYGHYSSAYASYKAKEKQYDAAVKAYNDLADQYNSLLKKLYA